MQYRKLGQSGIDASVVAFGAWAIGGWMWGGTEESESIKTIHAAIDCGMGFIDTAPVYGFGTSEKIVGKAIQGKRDKVILATKCGLVWHTDKGNRFFDSDEKQVGHGEAKYTVHRYLGADAIKYEVEESLKRLGTDYIDLYQTHWQDPTTPIEETMEALLDLKKAGKIRAIGVSNATTEEMDRYRAVGPLDSDQEKYSMLDRKLDASNLPYMEKNNMAFLAYSPIAQGLLTGKVGPERKFEDGDQRNNSKRFSVENRKRISAMLDSYKCVAEKHGVTLAQLAIAWTIRQPGCSHALVGARTPQQALENAKAGDIALTNEDVDIINKAVSELVLES
ncbi:MAG: aldo/keto reductase [Planctomycetes bacterium]|nr:aldo/keto reductase [Planctomycetota bacterium]